MQNYLLKSQSSQYHECGYSCDNAVFLSLGDDKFFITDSRYKEEAKTIQNAELIISQDLAKTANDLLKKHKIKALKIDPKELDLFFYEKLAQDLKVNFIRKPNLGINKRAIKTPNELEYLAKAARLGAKCFAQIAKNLQENLSEKELYKLSVQILNKNLDLSFEPIIAINQNASKPHALPTSKRLKLNDLVLLDAGVKYKRFCSDRTRVLEFGSKNAFVLEPKFSKARVQKVYDIVLKAKETAQKFAKIGVKASDVDKAARQVIEKSGFGEFFIHSLGHGVGLDIHEAPFISHANNQILEENMVFTIEPGIYLPGQFGIRIEDTVVLKSGGVCVL